MQLETKTAINVSAIFLSTQIYIKTEVRIERNKVKKKG